MASEQYTMNTKTTRIPEKTNTTTCYKIKKYEQEQINSFCVYQMSSLFFFSPPQTDALAPAPAPDISNPSTVAKPIPVEAPVITATCGATLINLW